MKSRVFTLAIFSLLLVCGIGTARPTSANPTTQTDDYHLYLPMIANGLQAIRVDHRHTDIRQIPQAWIDQARGYVVHYAHTSHGSQVLSGLNWLESRDARFNVDIEASGTVILPDDATALRVYDGNNYDGDTYITPDQYWESETGKNHTRAVADTGWFDFSLWTWCGQMSTYEDAPVQAYIDTMAQFESEYPGMRFIYYTGHTDGSAPGPDSKLWRHNDMVRQYVQQQGKVLFDFADIEVLRPGR